jgi:hypothetical protein
MRITTKLLMCIALVGVMFHPQSIVGQQPGQTPTIDQVPDGMTITPLAGAVVNDILAPKLSYRYDWILERLPLAPGQQIDGRDKALAERNFGKNHPELVGTHHLLLGESGNVQLVSEGTQNSLGVYESTFISRGIPYSIRNDTGDCASVLRLSATTFGALGGISSASEDVPHEPSDCGEPSVVAGGTAAIPEGTPPMLLFMASISVSPGGSQSADFVSHPGSIAFLVQSGIVTVQECCSTKIAQFLQPGSTVAIPEYTDYRLSARGKSEASALMAGVIPAEAELFEFRSDRPPFVYTSPTHDLTLAWDHPWKITGESWSSEAPVFSIVRLTRGETIDIRIESLDDYDGNELRCVGFYSWDFEHEAGISNVERIDPATGVAPAEGVVVSTIFWLSYDRTDETGATERLIRRIECRTLEPGRSVVIIDATLQPENLGEQAQLVEELLSGLQIGKT